VRGIIGQIAVAIYIHANIPPTTRSIVACPAAVKITRIQVPEKKLQAAAYINVQ